MADLTAAQEDNRVVLNRWLGDIGLTGMESQVLEWITASRSPEYIKIEMTKTPIFKQTFPEYDAAIAAGNPMTPAQILDYRKTVKSIFSNNGVPDGFYDSNDDFVDLITKRLSPQELEQRVLDGYTRVAGAPQEVKDVFNQYFGVQGDAMLATFYLDPARGQKFLSDAATQAEIGGAGAQYGFGLTQTEAERYQTQGITGAAARTGFKQAYQFQGLAEESVSETGDITRGQIAEGVLTGGEAEQRMQRRQQERSAAFQGGTGSAATTRTGLGLGGT